MKLDDAQNCTFRPIVRSKLPQKMKICETDGVYGKPEGIKKVIERATETLEGIKLKKRGHFKKALFMYLNPETGVTDAYKILCEHFNIQ